MKNILVTYATNAGSTAEVVLAIAEELGRKGAQVEICQIKEVTTVEDYDVVVVGAPMIMGWHRDALKFVKKHRKVLSKLKVAYFMMAMSLIQTGEHSLPGMPIFVDPKLAKPPQNPDRLNFRERYATVGEYLQPVLKAAPDVKPVSIGFFGGKLDLYRLSWWQKLFVLLVVQAQPGEFRNWDFIREWAARLGDEIVQEG
jgi:menaquinone-dependent protoporphyrinogen IX oxidase